MRLMRRCACALGVTAHGPDGRPRHPRAVSRARWRLRILLAVLLLAVLLPLFIVRPVPQEPAAPVAGAPYDGATPATGAGVQPPAIAMPKEQPPAADLPPALPAPEPASTKAIAPPQGPVGEMRPDGLPPQPDEVGADGKEYVPKPQDPRLDPAVVSETGRAVAQQDPDPVARRGEIPAAVGPAAGPAEVLDRPARQTADLVRPRLRPVAPPSASPEGRRAGTIAIIIDDMGPARAWSERAIALPAPLTMSFLPYARTLPELVAMARGRGHQIFLHMPMEPVGETAPGPNALLAGMAPDTLRERLGWAIGRVPDAVGMNNHMGSRLTTDPAAMAVVMAELARSGLVFIDSRTSSRSVAAAAAAVAGLPHSSRDIFLDHFPTAGFVRRQLESLEATAHRAGTAIAIGHPLPVTLGALEAWIPAAKTRGFEFVSATTIIDRQGCDGETPAGRCGLRLTASHATDG
jgi:polysaccharide deacetylase 2 family uncharacterized protein YibQ